MTYKLWFKSGFPQREARSFEQALKIARREMEKEWITREEYEWIVEDGICNDIQAGGNAVSPSDTRSSREYVEGYLRDQYLIYGEDCGDAE